MKTYHYLIISLNSFVTLRSAFPYREPVVSLAADKERLELVERQGYRLHSICQEQDAVIFELAALLTEEKP